MARIAKQGSYKARAAKQSSSVARAAKQSSSAARAVQRVVRTPSEQSTRKLTAAQDRTRFLVDALGSQRSLAELLGVSVSQPSRWAKGAEAPSPQRSRELVDLDHVVARAGLLWTQDVVRSWLFGTNAFLEGARPIDVLRLRGASEVIAALDAETSGAYA